MFGKSGCGKTSFLQAGLIPMFTRHNSDHLPVYVKFSNMDPMECIQQAFIEQIGWRNDRADEDTLSNIIKQITNTHKKIPVLLFDQFEQFFVHFQHEEQRLPLINLLTEWYKKANTLLPIKLLFIFRYDYYACHIELQQTIGYTLSPHDSFELKKFTPKQATKIFKVIAEVENLAYDEKFIEQITYNDLRNNEDDLISPVDIQILSWMISEQAESGEKVFNKKFFQKMGGIEGLLETYLSRAVNVVEPESQRCIVYKVLRSLIDENVRAGVLTLEEIQQKLLNEAKPDLIEKAVNWLSQGNVRLITPVKRKDIRAMNWHMRD